MSELTSPLNAPCGTFKISVVNTKGGVGKTTLTANLGALLADMGMRTLLIDADQQPSLSKYYEIYKTAPHGLRHVMKHVTIDESCIAQTTIENLDLIVSDDNGSIVTELSKGMGWGARLRNAVNSAYVVDHYDFVLIDTQGSAGPLQEAAALAGDIILCPTFPDALSARELLQGTMSLLDRLEDGRLIGLAPGPIHCLIQKHENLRVSHQIVKAIRNEFLSLKGRVNMMNFMVPSSRVFLEASATFTPAHRIQPHWEEPRFADDRLIAQGSGSTIMHKLLWELIPSFEGQFVNEAAMPPASVNADDAEVANV